MDLRYSRSSYQYEPLLDGQIRLLEVHGQTIRTVEHVFLADNPSYEALSYCWGDPRPTEKLSYGDGKYIEVTKNLQAALINLARTEIPHDAQRRLVWADAICINQQDIEEKNVQVGMMREIYRNAQAVQIWVGEEEEDDDKGFDLLRRLLHVSSSRTTSQHTHSISYMTPRTRATFLGLGNTWKDAFYVESGIVALLKMVDRPWFRRIWIVQEVGVARKAWLNCGKLSIEWEDFIQAIRYSIDVRVRPLEGYGREMALKIAQTRDTRRGFQLSQTTENQGENLLSLLSRFHDFEATNPLDMIYALLGLTSNSTGITPSDIRVKIDYGLKKDEVYTHVARTILSKTGNLDILSACHLVPNERNGWGSSINQPSWVPDWSSSGKHVSLRLQGSWREDYFDFVASGSHTQCVPKFPDNRTLCLNGILFDKVTAVSLPAETRRAPPDETPGIVVIFTDWFKEMYRTHLMFRSIDRMFNFGRHKAKYVTGESMFDVYWQTRICGCYGPEGYDVLYDYFHDKAKEGNWRHFPPPLIPRNFAPGLWIFSLAYIVNLIWLLVKGLFGVKRKPAEVDTLLSGKQEHMAYGLWKFIKTEKGYLGLAPASTQLGDWIGIFEGGKVPLVLRKTEDAQSWYMIGESYVHGIMKGEAFDERNCIEINIV
ncbi:hypothetical protein BP6252_06783 [Coleophoma cylindrospora]|uniref:Heterokaryon incompatibility domain-containing protein n=1 Tax=Coleophoma cylindrospora TaxID=1849047 RepID=A0A3D8RFY5_9HELO|nr:hypothetical protein BP6252_06783 [Coleophoma cylindrospora]